MENKAQTFEKIFKAFFEHIYCEVDTKFSESGFNPAIEIEENSNSISIYELFTDDEIVTIKGFYSSLNQKFFIGAFFKNVCVNHCYFDNTVNFARFLSDDIVPFLKTALIQITKDFEVSPNN